MKWKENTTQASILLLVHKCNDLDIFRCIRVTTQVPRGRVNTVTALNINYEIETNNLYNLFSCLSFYSIIQNC